MRTSSVLKRPLREIFLPVEAQESSARCELRLSARYMAPDRAERDAETVFFTESEVGFVDPVQPTTGSRLVVYIDCLGRVEGIVSRHTKAGFVLKMQLHDLKRHRLMAEVAAIRDRLAAGMTLLRRHERIVPLHRETTVVDPSGNVSDATVCDISRSGAGLKMHAQLNVGDVVIVGRRARGSVSRPIDGGFAIEFLRMIPVSEFGDLIEL